MKTLAISKLIFCLSIFLSVFLFESQETNAQLQDWQETIIHNPCPGDSLGSIEISFYWNGYSPPLNFLWSNGATTQNIYFLPVGNYSVSITSSPNYGSTYAEFYVGIYDTLQVSDSIVDATVLGASNGEIHLTASTGSGNYNYSWAHGDTTSSIYNLFAGVYYVTIIDSQNCADAVETYFVNSPIPPGWEVTPTNKLHDVFIETSTCVQIGDSILSKGSLIGAFREENGIEVCQGYCFWNQQETVLSIYYPNSNYTIFGNNWSESLFYKVFESFSGTSYIANECCDYCSHKHCLDNGYTMDYGEIECLSVGNVYTQTISLWQGWSTFSVALDPDPANFEAVFAPIIGDVKIIKDINGLVYWPEYNVNFLGDVEIGKGYQIKTLSAQSITVTGYNIFPNLIPLTLPSGWSLFGYYSKTPSYNHIDFFASGASNLIVAKNASGQIYWPIYGLGNNLDLLPGEAWWAKMSAPATFYLPPHNCNQN